MRLQTLLYRLYCVIRKFQEKWDGVELNWAYQLLVFTTGDNLLGQIQTRLRKTTVPILRHM